MTNNNVQEPEIGTVKHTGNKSGEFVFVKG